MHIPLDIRWAVGACMSPRRRLGFHEACRDWGLLALQHRAARRALAGLLRQIEEVCRAPTTWARVDRARALGFVVVGEDGGGEAAWWRVDEDTGVAVWCSGADEPVLEGASAAAHGRLLAMEQQIDAQLDRMGALRAAAGTGTEAAAVLDAHAAVLRETGRAARALRESLLATAPLAAREWLTVTAITAAGDTSTHVMDTQVFVGHGFPAGLLEELMWCAARLRSPKV
jgi:hypothetical protein